MFGLFNLFTTLILIFQFMNLFVLLHCLALWFTDQIIFYVIYYDDTPHCTLTVGLVLDSMIDNNAFVVSLLMVLPSLFGCVFNLISYSIFKIVADFFVLFSDRLKYVFLITKSAFWSWKQAQYSAYSTARYFFFIFVKL